MTNLNLKLNSKLPNENCKMKIERYRAALDLDSNF